MASSKSYKDFIMEQLSNLNPTCKSMMGEFLIYVDGVYFGGVFDDRFLVKITDTNSVYDLSKELPYENAKSMYVVQNVDDKEYLETLVLDTIKGLKKIMWEIERLTSIKKEPRFAVLFLSSKIEHDILIIWKILNY